MFVGTSRTGPIYKPRCPSRVFVLPSETHSSQNSSFVKARLFERIFTHRNVRGQQALMLCLSFHHHLHLLTGLIYSVVVMYSKINLGSCTWYEVSEAVFFDLRVRSYVRKLH